MTKPEHIAYWLESAEENWQTVNAVRHISRPMLVFTHWVLEKLSKALWVRQHTEDIPPISDNVAELLAETSFVLTPAQTTFVARLKAFHDDELEPDFENPRYRVRATETPETLVAEAAQLRELLLGALT